MSQNKEYEFDPAYNNSGEGKLQVPGFGLPLNYWPVSESTPSYIQRSNGDMDIRFVTGLMDYKAPRMVVREIQMLNFINSITEKPMWHEKVFNNEILSKWKSEASESRWITERTFEWCVKELQEKALSYKDDKLTLVFDQASGVVKSDTLIEEALKTELKNALRPLQSLPNPDWHPNSNEQVMNLVHPSLFPLVYGKTHVLTSGVVGLQNMFEHAGKGEIAPKQDMPAPHTAYQGLRYGQGEYWSTCFQWLPAEVRFRNTDSNDVEITSYINNLHPHRYPEVYPVIEKFIAASIEPWNKVLVRGSNGRKPERIRTYGVELRGGDDPEWIKQLVGKYGEEDPEISEELWEKVREHMAKPDREDFVPDSWREHDPADFESLRGWDLWSVVSDKTKSTREFVHPEPGVPTSYEDWKAGKIKPVVKKSYHYGVHGKDDGNDHIEQHETFDVCLQDEFRDRGLQVIVKLSSIELTPDKPTYAGGSWHVEGMQNEHIVGTAIYYYDVENTTESSIQFRQEALLDDMELVYEQSDHDPLATIFGCEGMTNEPAVQELGRVTTPEGRLIAFPNTLQHCVSPFELEDKSKPGHRRFLVLWLVDPHMKILSTANVPAQQHEWWTEEAKKHMGTAFPAEVQEMILNFTKEGSMTLDEAKELRLQLMEERTKFTDTVESNFEEYNLCEH